MKEKIKKALAGRQKRCLPAGGLQPAAVLLLVFEKGGEPHVLFTRRTNKVLNHKGQISFPGGTYEEEDGCLLNTALRECFEEIGVEPGDVEVLGELDDMPTMATSFMLSPFVATMPYPYTFKVNSDEVEELIDVPLAYLLDKSGAAPEAGGSPWPGGEAYTYNYNGRVIWGATARVLAQFLSLVKQES